MGEIMKKFKLMAILLACVLLICGCGPKNNNIKLHSTSLSVADFFHESIDEVGFLCASAQGEVSGTNNELDFALITMMALSGNGLVGNLVSAVDFCMEVANSDNKDGSDQKIYEYLSDYPSVVGQSKTIVHVAKAQGKNNVFIANSYSSEDSATYKDLVDAGMVPEQSNTFTISIDKSSGVYSFTDTANNISGTLNYRSDLGTLNIVISYKIAILGGQKFDSEFNFYNYTNNVLGSRMLTSTTVENQKVQYIFESLGKPFEKRAKVGIVKNTNAYVNMAATEEAKIGVANSGDVSGYQISYLDDSDANLPYTTVKNYGLKG